MLCIIMLRVFTIMFVSLIINYVNFGEDTNLFKIISEEVLPKYLISIFSSIFRFFIIIILRNFTRNFTWKISYTLISYIQDYMFLNGIYE